MADPTERPRSAPEKFRLGIVLSGGGSRGIAHIGVLRALLEHGIFPDCVAGTSSGAIVGALYAAGHSPAKMMEFFRQTDPFRVGNVAAFAKPGIWDSMKYFPAFRKYFPADSFEALKHKLYVVATDFFSGQATVFDSGPLVLPILASSSVPMIFSPTEIGGRWYGDGGIVDNFPAGLLRDRCDVLIGVHVSPLREVTALELGTSVSVLERALEVGMFARAQENFQHCHLVIRPRNLSRFGMFDTKHFADIEATGYDEASTWLPEIKRLILRAETTARLTGTISATDAPTPPRTLAQA